MFQLITIFVIIYIFRKLFSQSSAESQQQTQTTNDSTFRTALLHILAAEMMADGRVTKSELDVVKQVLIVQFGEEGAKTALLELREILKTNINTRQAAIQMGMTLSYTAKLQVVQILCDIAAADGIVTDSEVATIRGIAYNMGVSNIDTQRILSKLNINGNYTYGNRNYNNDYTSGHTTQNNTSSLAEAYKTLGITSEATNAELKEAYRNLAKKYHPDRVASQGENAQKEAEKKFKEIQTAYERIKTARGL